MPKERTPTVQAIITAGEPVAAKLYRAFFGNEPNNWRRAFFIGHKMKELKKAVRSLYPTHDEVRLLHQIGTYSEEEMLDVLVDAKIKDDLCKGNPQSSIGELIMRSMETPKRQLQR